MKLVLYIIAVLLVIAWILGFFIFSAGMFIHVLVIAAAISFLQAIIIAPKAQPDQPSC